MKKRKINIGNTLIAALILIFLIVCLVMLFKSLKKDFKVDMNTKTIQVGEEFTNEFKAYYKGIDVTDNVKIDTNLNNNKSGVYDIKYNYSKNNKTYTVTKKIKVIDTVKPEITLKGGKEIIVMLNSTFNDPGYVALDNSDGDISSDVKVSGKVNTEKEGEYIIKYSVKDKSNNLTEMERKVIVTSSSPLSLSVKDFTLEGMFESVTLKETKDGGEEYTNSIIFAGDSMALYYVINEQISGKNLWHQISITPETALTSPIYINHIDTGKTFVQNFEKYKPDMVIMTLGTNSAAYMTPEYFYQKYSELITDIKKASPKTKLIIQSIPPVDASFDEKETGINNDKINKLNYYIGKMCEDLGVKFLNSASAMKDENGACKKGYCREDDGIHPTKEGQEALIKYARTHMYE